MDGGARFLCVISSFSAALIIRLSRVRLSFLSYPLLFSRLRFSQVLGSGWAKSEERASPNFKLRDTTNDQSRQRRLRLHPRALHLHVCNSRIPPAIHPSEITQNVTYLIAKCHLNTANIIYFENLARKKTKAFCDRNIFDLINLISKYTILKRAHVSWCARTYLFRL